MDIYIILIYFLDEISNQKDIVDDNDKIKSGLNCYSLIQFSSVEKDSEYAIIH